MRNNSWSLYLIIIVLIVILVYLDSIFMTRSTYSTSTWDFNYSALIIPLFLKICIGLVLGLEQTLRNISREGKWNINIAKLVLIGLPSLFFSIVLLLAYLGLPIFSITVLQTFLKSGYISILASIFQVIFGYSLVTSFYKVKIKE